MAYNLFASHSNKSSQLETKKKRNFHYFCIKQSINQLINQSINCRLFKIQITSNTVLNIKFKKIHPTQSSFFSIPAHVASLPSYCHHPPPPFPALTHLVIIAEPLRDEDKRVVNIIGQMGNRTHIILIIISIILLSLILEQSYYH